MNDTQKKAIELISLDDAAFFVFGDDDIVRLQSALGDLCRYSRPSGPPGAEDHKKPEESPAVLAIAAPKEVDIRKRAEVPILVASCQTGLRRWEVKYDENATIVTVDLTTGLIRTGQPFLPEKRLMTTEPSMSGSPPDKINARAITASIRKVDLDNIIGLGQHPSRFAITMIVYDWVSNTVVLELIGEEESKHQLPTLSPSAFLKSSVATNRTPVLTEEKIALSVPYAVGKDTSIPIDGVASIPLPESAAFPSKSDDPKRDDRTPTAVVPAVLLLLKRDGPLPIKLDMRLPVYATATPSVGEIVDIFFAFDLRGALSGIDLSGTYQIYFFIGDKVAGPFPLIVDQENKRDQT